MKRFLIDNFFSGKSNPASSTYVFCSDRLTWTTNNSLSILQLSHILTSRHLLIQASRLGNTIYIWCVYLYTEKCILLCFIIFGRFLFRFLSRFVYTKCYLIYIVMIVFFNKLETKSFLFINIRVNTGWIFYLSCKYC